MVAFLGLVVPEFVRLPVPDNLDYCYSASVLEAHKACAKSPDLRDGRGPCGKAPRERGGCAREDLS